MGTRRGHTQPLTPRRAPGASHPPPHHFDILRLPSVDHPLNPCGCGRRLGGREGQRSWGAPKAHQGSSTLFWPLPLVQQGGLRSPPPTHLLLLTGALGPDFFSDSRPH